MATKKKQAEVPAEEPKEELMFEEIPAEEPAEVPAEEPQLPHINDLYHMKFRDDQGNILMVRKAYGYRQRGKLEVFCPPKEV